VYDLKTVQRSWNEDLFAERVSAGLSAAFGRLAAVAGGARIYGVLRTSWFSGRARLEIRLALGASAGH